MDNIARNAMLAKQAGVSYGKWMAIQEPVKAEKKPDNWQICAFCGEKFKPKTKKKQIYCGAICCSNAQMKKRRANKRGRLRGNDYECKQ